MRWFRARPMSPPPTAAAIVDVMGLMRRARRLRFRVPPEAVSALAGAYRGARPGSGLTFSELRAYEPGDDARHIDRNVTARQGRPFVRRYSEERALTLWVVVDVSASLQFGPPGGTKADRAAQAAALLAGAAIGSGDRAGLLLITDRIESELPPGGGTRHLGRLLRTLVATRPVERRTDLTIAVERIRRTARHAVVILLSDFLQSGSAAPWRSLGTGADLLGLRLVDPREERLPAVGLLALTEAESGQTRLIDTNSARVRDDYARAAEERRIEFRHWCNTAGMAGQDLFTDVDPLGPLTRLFHARARRRSRR